MKSATLFLAFLSIALTSVPARADETWDIAHVGDTPFPIEAKAIDGTPISLASLKGKVVVLYLFTTQTGAGMTELMLLQRDMWPKFRDQAVAIIGIARNSGPDDLAKATRTMNIKFPLIADPNKEIFNHFATRGHPRLYVIGKDGTIKRTSLGYSDDELDLITRTISMELKNPAAAPGS